MGFNWEDVVEVKKITKKIEHLFAEKGSHQSEFYLSSKDDFHNKIKKELTKKLLSDFDKYVLDPISRILVVFFIFNPDSEERIQKLYYFNPEGFMSPNKIKVGHFDNLTKFIINDYKNFIEKENNLKSFEAGFHFYQLD